VTDPNERRAPNAAPRRAVDRLTGAVAMTLDSGISLTTRENDTLCDAISDLLCAFPDYRNRLDLKRILEKLDHAG